jgi:hypothetical protein
VSVPAAPERIHEAPRLRVVPPPERASRVWLLALGAVCLVAAVYHWLQSLGHATPAVFTDELLFSELARSFASGDGFVVRGEHLFFPAFVPSLLQAPAWLAGSTPLAYGIAKTINTVLMCSAALPAYWLARRLVRPTHALLVAVATVAGGGMVYHGYLTSEAAAYPVFLLAIAVCVAALERPSWRWDLLAVAVLGLAVLTRAQFVVLPAVFFLAVLLVGRPLRRHATALAALGLGGALVLAAGHGALGFYAGAGELDYPVGGVVRWTGWTAALLPYGAGLLIVPGALVGLVLALRSPRVPAERAFGILTGLLLVLMPLQAGLIASGEAHKPFERYVFYLVPLLFIAFFVFAERRSAGRLYVALAAGMGALAIAIPFASMALDSFAFDSTTLSAVEAVAGWTSQGEAAAIFGAVGVLAALAAAVLRRRPLVLAVAAIVLSFLVGLAAYAGDHRMTQRTLDSLAPAQRDWLERTGIPGADVLLLPGGSLHSGWVLESWNRNVGRTYHLGDLPEDPLPNRSVGLDPDGTVSQVGGAPIRSRYLVVNDAGSQVDVVGRRLADLPEGLSLYRLDGPLRFRSVALGVYRDRWAQSVASFAVFPGPGVTGRYRLTLSLPKGGDARRVEVEAGPVRRAATLRPGTPLTLEVPVSSAPVPELSIRIERADFVDVDQPKPRLVGARVEQLEFVAQKGSRK